jgi:hypothetical protein
MNRVLRFGEFLNESKRNVTKVKITSIPDNIPAKIILQKFCLLRYAEKVGDVESVNNTQLGKLRDQNVGFEIIKESEEFLLEGGAYGHLLHPFEDMNLTMSDLHDMIQATVKGAFGPENFVMEKCLSGDSIVHLEKNGPTTIYDTVENQIEDNILTSDSIGELSYQPIMDWVKHENSNEWIEIETEDGNVIRVTPNHRIFVDGLDIKAEDLKIGDELLTFKN